MAKPLVYSDPASGTQVLIVAASSNWVYLLDAQDGTLLNSRQLRKPYSESDLPCGDLIPETGVLGTPVIDRATGTLYLYAKGYRTENVTGPFNAAYVSASCGGLNTVTNVSRYHLHAVDAITLEERPNFPVLVDGPASNVP
jgi:iron transport multicopper oxidase